MIICVYIITTIMFIALFILGIYSASDKSDNLLRTSSFFVAAFLCLLVPTVLLSDADNVKAQEERLINNLRKAEKDLDEFYLKHPELRMQNINENVKML